MSIPFENNILRVMVYFDLFHYPITKEEIHQFLDKKADPIELDKSLTELNAKRLIFRFGQFYALHNDQKLINRRIRGNELAKRLMPKAVHISNFLYQFPFVRAVGISGSLSKNYADESSDFDYFIVTQSGRLWISRTIMHAFKKLTFLTGRQHYYCMNYFVDEEGMQIEEKNIFTATELSTLIPVCGNGAMDSFFEANEWVNRYFPNHPVNVPQKTKFFGNALKTFIEWFLSHRIFNLMEKYLMHLTAARWKRKEELNKINKRGIRMGIQANEHFAKPNPVFFQQKILLVYEERLAKFEKKWQDRQYSNLSDSLSK